jgi:dTDP-4-dehydrorhamnose reductase
MLRLGAERDEVSVVDDQRGSPTFVGHLAAATRQVIDLPVGTYHVAPRGGHVGRVRRGDLREAGLGTRVRRITTEELGRPAPRPAYSVLRSEKGAPTLPHWHDGLRETLAAIQAAEAAE